ncbi:hypothetical protein LTR97_004975 [Elasticomyces elasticus]|uniref:Uncharacterized protein n=1 Tax=Elasticomyces elasticus TaxID=574655 RepID=A0AAN7W9C2_9PEZI|nr:hypothetical protein LTR97_004975 [Elasticomyces elasticus]
MASGCTNDDGNTDVGCGEEEVESNQLQNHTTRANFRKYPQLLAFRDGLGMQQQWKDDIHLQIGPANHAVTIDGGKRTADPQAFSKASTLYLREPRALGIRAITGDWVREKDVGVYGKALAKTSRDYMKLLEIMEIASEHC